MVKEDLSSIEPLVESICEKLVLTSSVNDCFVSATQEEKPWTTVHYNSKSHNKKKPNSLVGGWLQGNV